MAELIRQVDSSQTFPLVQPLTATASMLWKVLNLILKLTNQLCMSNQKLCLEVRLPKD